MLKKPFTKLKPIPFKNIQGVTTDECFLNTINTYLSPKVNGKTLETLVLIARTRQGCSPSPQLFYPMLEALAI